MTDEYDYKRLAKELSAIVERNDRLSINEDGVLDRAVNALEAAAEDGSDTECPICGQPYANKIEPSENMKFSSRSDVRVCRNKILTEKAYYIHLPSREADQ